MLTFLFLRPIENLARVISFSSVTYNLFICRMGEVEYYLHRSGWGWEGEPYKDTIGTRTCTPTHIYHMRTYVIFTHSYTQAKYLLDKGNLAFFLSFQLKTLEFTILLNDTAYFIISVPYIYRKRERKREIFIYLFIIGDNYPPIPILHEA